MPREIVRKGRGVNGQGGGRRPARSRRAPEFLVAPKPEDPQLTRQLDGSNEYGERVAVRVPVECPLTVFLNGREIVTMMTIGDHPDWLAVGYLLNQNMLRPDDQIAAIDHDDVIDTIVVRTKRRTDYEAKLRKKTLTSGCAQGTAFGDVMENFERSRLPENAVLKTSWLYALLRKINSRPSLYLSAGAIHGCVLCQGDRPLLYLEDVGRHNAVDKICGYMHLHQVPGGDKVFYTTGRLTSEMVIKCASMGIPILVSRSGFTSWGVELARAVGLTLLGRARGHRFLVLSGVERVVYDADPRHTPKEAEGRQRQAAGED
ncbi:MAG: formate dehydrogenase accessory sulfurtransferase FdhD [Alphaproteobacteria bacterium]|nr:formate dehydrogenase accessory sulfurtransferase FdhD [Alphaproteobacteria bacterium]